MQDKLANLQKFIANNYALESLEAKLNEFNPLKVLKVDQYEIRHSNVLSWLLTPEENHNIGNSFLKKVLAEIILNNENIETSLSVFDTEKMSYGDFEIKREWQNIDILAISHNNRICIIIENKIYANESKGQLEKYFETVKNEYKNYELIPVFLTLDGVEPSDTRYGILSYTQVLKILEFIVSIQKENMNEKVYDFINYYLKTLEILTMEDKKIKQLCKEIYKDHKEALDLIYEYAEDTDFEESASEFIQNINAQEIYIDGKSAWFMPKEFKKYLKKVGEEKWCENLPFAFWFMVQEEKLGIIIEVRPFVSASLRQNFLKHLKNHDINIHDYSFKAGAKYTRIFTKYPRFEDWDNKESIIQKMDELYKKFAKKTEANLLEACKTFNWEDA
jgi:hypothetical protein